ncbi:glycoside hydrolase family 16 protein [Sphingomonas rosea]|uniref:Glycoside hydrolase family 16 protein n=1 Tax=Sphingomonas rosea TaxID=335605 RepID=A0ABP7TRX5_9SPHN
MTLRPAMLLAALALAGCTAADGGRAVAAPTPVKLGPDSPKKIVATVAMPGPGEAREPARERGWQLVWSDEFEGTAVDRTKWDFDRDCWGGGNNERQCYTDRTANAAVGGGLLTITARKERFTGPAQPAQLRPASGAVEKVTKDFTSARMVTRGKASWTYGRIEMRAKLPAGQGTWPAFWMLPEDKTYGPWAASGEIDILEAVNLGVPCASCPGSRENTILGTLHFGGQWPANAFNSTETKAVDVLDGFHTFGVVWAPGRIDWTYDGRVYATKRRGEWWSAASNSPDAPFDRAFHLILNLAVGGGLSEERGVTGVDETIWPQTMQVDWVRVWQCRPDGASGQSCQGDR